MARVRESEYVAKKVLFSYLSTRFEGERWIGEKAPKLKEGKKYVVKVDDGTKGRMKKGLVKTDASARAAQLFAKSLLGKKYTHIYAEPFVKHKESDEQFISFERTREGILVLYSKHGGINVEESKDILSLVVSKDDAKLLSSKTGIPEEFLEGVLEFFESEHISFLEMNPILVKGKKVHVLDLAVLRDTAGTFFAPGEWNELSEQCNKEKTHKEKVQALANTTSSSLAFEPLNKNGSIFALFSGGGASLILSDRASHKGVPDILGNYGEYSGNPPKDVLERYSSIIIDALLKSRAKKKALVISGGVANFTDVAQTFAGIEKALFDTKEKLKKQGVKVFVRRGGPNEKTALEHFELFLKGAGLYGGVYGSTAPLTQAMDEAIRFVKK